MGGVVRTNGKCGKITVNYTTVQKTAVPGRDYAHAEGVLTFQEGETHKTLQVQIMNSSHHASEGNENFKVVLSNPSPGVKFDEHTDGGKDRAICDVWILKQGKVSCVSKWMRH